MSRQVVTLTRRRSETTNEWPGEELLSFVSNPYWQPTPIREYIVKIASRCNLACDYCYIYEMQDTSWAQQAYFMPPLVAEKLAERIAIHVADHGINSITLVMHGGEPLLAGVKRMEKYLNTWRSLLDPLTEVKFSLQTNGLLLSEEMMDLLYRFGVSVGVSLDGGREPNDKHRKRRSGAGSYELVANRLQALRRSRYASIYGGILATIDVENDPVDVYESLCLFEPPMIDFLLPHGNWSDPPPRFDATQTNAPYADWLIAVFDQWQSALGWRPQIRIFQDIVQGLSGGKSSSELLGLGPVALATIETDGSYGLVDTLKSAYQGASVTNLNVFDDDFDRLLEVPSVIAGQIGLDGLSEKCNSCRHVATCGGGYLPHRYRSGHGFLNPSVYCHELAKLIDHIDGAKAEVLAL